MLNTELISLFIYIYTLRNRRTTQMGYLVTSCCSTYSSFCSVLPCCSCCSACSYSSPPPCSIACISWDKLLDIIVITLLPVCLSYIVNIWYTIYQYQTYVLLKYSSIIRVSLWLDEPALSHVALPYHYLIVLSSSSLALQTVYMILENPRELRKPNDSSWI